MQCLSLLSFLENSPLLQPPVRTITLIKADDIQRVMASHPSPCQSSFPPGSRMNYNLYTGPGRPSPAPPQALHGRPRKIISAILDSPALPLPESGRAPVRAEDIMSTAESSQWPPYLGVPNCYQMGTNYQSYHGMPLEIFNRRACLESNLPDSFLWPENAYSYPLADPLVACPRSYQRERLSSPTSGPLDPISEAYPPAAYHLDPPQYSLFADEEPQEPIDRSSHMELESKALEQLRIDRIDHEMDGGLFPSTRNRDDVDPVDSGNLSDNYAPDLTPTVEDDDDDMDGTTNEEPYAKLIYKALMSAPDHRMVLREIYQWFEHNTDKARNSSSKGWQNSIRHNLSMNGVSSIKPFRVIRLLMEAGLQERRPGASNR